MPHLQLALELISDSNHRHNILCRLEGNTVMAVVLDPSIFYDNSRYGIVLITYSDASHHHELIV